MKNPLKSLAKIVSVPILLANLESCSPPNNCKIKDYGNTLIEANYENSSREIKIINKRGSSIFSEKVGLKESFEGTEKYNKNFLEDAYKITLDKGCDCYDFEKTL